VTLRVERLSGSALSTAIPELARLRIAVFRDWPYLYDGSDEYERSYLAKFGAAPGAVVVGAYDGGRMIGAATATPMLGHEDEFAEPFRKRGFDVARIFYFGESVLLRDYRGRGLGHAFFDEREAHAREMGDYAMTAFCAVVRPDDHPLKPKDYMPLDAFWRKRGYEKVDGMIASFSWKDIDQPAETAKPMQFWAKAFTR
jgi:GNAT superfamily N-acetyltransferase